MRTDVEQTIERWSARSSPLKPGFSAPQEDSDPNGIRTRVTAVKGRCPRPLDDRVRKAGGNIGNTANDATYLPSGSTLESVAVEGAAQLAGAGEVAGMKAKGGCEHSLLQVEIEMGREHGKQWERGGVVHLANDPFA